VFEDFYRTKNHKKLIKNSSEIKKILDQEFLFVISEINFKKILKKRKILVILQPIIHETIFLWKNLKKFSTKLFITFLLRIARTFINCCMIYRFCRYVDFINLHLMALMEIFNQKFIETSNSEKIAMKKISAIRRCYFKILKMNEELMVIEKWTTLIHFFVMLLSIIRRLYRMYTVIKGALPLSETSCEFKFF
jgi:hypothetical protein